MNKKHSCSNTDSYSWLDTPGGLMCSCGKPLSKEKLKEIDECWQKSPYAKKIKAKDFAKAASKHFAIHPLETHPKASKIRKALSNKSWKEQLNKKLTNMLYCPALESMIDMIDSMGPFHLDPELNRIYILLRMVGMPEEDVKTKLNDLIDKSNYINK